MLKSGFNKTANGKENNEDWGNRKSNIICCLFDVYSDGKDLDSESSGLLSKLGNLIKKLRNFICAVLYFGIVIYHVLHAFFPLPQTYRYKDIYVVGNNLMSMAFFGLMALYTHCLMYDETIRFDKSVQVGNEKKERQAAAAYKLDMKSPKRKKEKKGKTD